MAVYWISFNLEYDDDYSTRYNDLMNALKGEGPRYWDATTSFVLLESSKSCADLAAVIKGAIDPSRDLALIKREGQKVAYVIGSNPDNDIYTLIDYAKNF